MKRYPRTKEIIYLLKRIDARRALNLGSTMISYLFSRVSGKPICSGYPMTLSIELTNHCNLRCPECRCGSGLLRREKGFMDSVTFDRILSECSPYLLSLILYFQGEPFLHPGLFQMIKKARTKRLHTMTSTNGQFLDTETARSVVESGLERIIISLDGMDQLVYEKYRKGGNVDKVKEGIKALVEWKKALRSTTPVITVQFLVFSHNQHQIEDVKNWSRKVGVEEVEIKSAMIRDFKNGNPLIPDEQYARYREHGRGGFIIKNKLKNHCWQTWHKAVITWDGKVLPCCFDYDGDHEMGNIMQQTFSDIWNGMHFMSFRTKLLQNRQGIPMCRNCTEGASYYL